MTTLIERCQLASTALAGVEAARRNAHLRALIQQRTQEWNDHLGKLMAVQQRARWIGLAPDMVAEFVAGYEQVRRNAQEASGRLTSGEDVSALTSDALWTRLLQSVANAAMVLENAVKAAWRLIVEAPGTLASPAELRSKLPATPSNQQALSAYSRHYAVYARLSAQSIPRTPDDKDVFARAVADCQSELDNVDYDVPQEVEAFFRAVYSNTAMLSIVTPEVWRWLSDNGHLDHFVVRSASL